MRSPDTEQRLDREFISYVYVADIPLAQFQIRTSRFQNRLDPVSDETIEEYGIAMEAGKDFPPLLTIKRDDQYIILDGHQRFTAATNTTRQVLDAYVLDLEDIEAQRYAHRVNLTHGTRVGRQARLGFALEEVDQSGDRELVNISRKYDLPPTTLRDAYNERQFERRSKNLPSGQTKRLNKSVKQALQQITLNAPFEQAVKFASDAGINPKEAKELVARINAAASEAEAIEVIRLKTELQKRKRGRAVSPIGPLFNELLELSEKNADSLARMMTAEERLRFNQVISPKFSQWWNDLNAVSLQKNVA